MATINGEIKFVKMMLAQVIKSKLSASVLIITIAWVLLDISERLIEDNVNSNVLIEQKTLPMLAPLKLTKNMEGALKTVFKKYGDGEGDALSAIEKTAAILSLEEQAKQSGELNTFFVGENSLQLKAIVVETQKGTASYVALIKITDQQTQIARIERFTNKQQVYGYNLVILSNTKANLSKHLPDDSKQEITLTMYGK